MFQFHAQYKKQKSSLIFDIRTWEFVKPNIQSFLRFRISVLIIGVLSHFLESCYQATVGITHLVRCTAVL